MNHQEELIGNIENEYLIEKSKQSSVIKGMWSQYQKMAKELSEGIYSEDNHFIYELIQNAEDTKSDEKTHDVEFNLTDEGLLFFNNERGFEEKEIKAICAFGDSTKLESKNTGYIGEKGIGFKSVFKVTDKPAISTNGYRFYFNRFDEDGNTEYVIPHWINDNEIGQYPEKFQRNTHTAIYLPFEQKKGKENLGKLKNDIKHIEPILLLFLNRLDSIKITENNDEILSTRKVKSIDENIESIGIESTGNNNKFYLFKKSIDVDQNLDEVIDKNGRRKKVKTRNIIIALPDLDNKDIEDRIFSFLPTKLHSELKFIIQADFILQSGREEVVEKLKKYSKLKYIYLEYFKRKNKSHNKLIDKLYNNIIERLCEENIIYTNSETWMKAKNMLFCPDIDIDTKYLKMLFGEHYEQIHKEFVLDPFFIKRFGIRNVTVTEIIERICSYFDNIGNKHKFNENIVFDLTCFISNNLSVDSRSRVYERNLFDRVKKALPILPKFKQDKKFYLYDAIYLSEEYKPDFELECLGIEGDFDFTKFNFLSSKYKDNNLDNFIKKIIEEQRDDKNRKTIKFFIEHSQMLQNYLLKNISKNYEHVLSFLMGNQIDNQERIREIHLLYTKNEIFCNGLSTIYFSNDSDDNLDILNDKLFNFIKLKKNEKYKEFLSAIFKVQEADIVNIILGTDIEWFKKNYYRRTEENDEEVIKRTERIVANFNKFEFYAKKTIAQELYFLPSNQKAKYLKSSYIYLSKSYARNGSIEEYLSTTKPFTFLDDKYETIFNKYSKELVNDFLKHFKFVEKKIKDSDLLPFLQNIKEDLPIQANIEVLRIVLSSEVYKKSRHPIASLKNYKVFSSNMKLVKIQDIFAKQTKNVPLASLHEKYEQKLGDLFKSLKSSKYFSNPYNIEPFIKDLETADFDKAKKIYRYLDLWSTYYKDDKGRKSDNGHTITNEKIRLRFKNKQLIFDDQNNKYFPDSVVWMEQKSGDKLFALSSVYSDEFQKFFVDKVNISQSKDIKRIFEELPKEKERNKRYFELLVDLNNLIIKEPELDRYFRTLASTIPFSYSPEEVKKFIAEEALGLIADDGVERRCGKLFFNDLEIKIPHTVKSKIFSIDRSFPLSAFQNLIDAIGIKRLSSLKTVTKYDLTNGSSYNIDNYRKILHFAYDLLYSRNYNKYSEIENRKSQLKEINFIDKVSIVDNIQAEFQLEYDSIPTSQLNHILRGHHLVLTDEIYLYKVIADSIKTISDKDIKDFVNEVIKGRISKEEYYKNENIKIKKNFILEISSNMGSSSTQEYKTEYHSENFDQDDFNESYDEGEDNSENDHIHKNTAEEDRCNRQQSENGIDNIKKYERDIEVEDDELHPEPVHNYDEYLANDSSGNPPKHRSKKKHPQSIGRTVSNQNSRYGEEETKSFLGGKNHYNGHCQICGFTFPTKGKYNYFERFCWNDLKHGGHEDVVSPGNSLCLCARCHSILKGGGDFDFKNINGIENALKSNDFSDFLKLAGGEKIENIPEKFNEHVEFNDMYAFNIRLNNREENIFFTEEHLLKFYNFLKPASLKPA